MIGINNSLEIIKNIISTNTAGKQRTQIFISSGTWIKPTNVTSVHVYMCGGGGGGAGFYGSYSQGGGGSGYLIDICTPVSENVTITIGGGGSGGASATRASDGGNTSFGSLVAKGGQGVNNASCRVSGTDFFTHGGSGGSGGGSGVINGLYNLEINTYSYPHHYYNNNFGIGINGNNGLPGILTAHSSVYYTSIGGIGGSGFLPGGMGGYDYSRNGAWNYCGGGGGGGWYPGVNASDGGSYITFHGKGGQGYGAGGGGGFPGQTNGGAGAQGICIVTWFE
jgi:hypothetical protein